MDTLMVKDARSGGDRAELARTIADVALLRGTFTLRSGRTSTYYLDKYLFSTRPEVLRCIPLVTAASLETGLPCVLVRNKKKDYGTAKQLEGALDPRDGVVIVEDVATTGGQALEAAAALKEAGANVLAIIAAKVRQEGARENVEKGGVRFEALFTKTDLGVNE